jgi:hypothetical protein
LLLVVLEVFLSLISGKLGYEKGTLTHSWRIVHSVFASSQTPFGGDSWEPMRQALEYWKTAPENTHIYTDLLTIRHIKFQYPPSSLFIPLFVGSLGVRPEFIYTMSTYAALVVLWLTVFSLAVVSIETRGIEIPANRHRLLLLLACAAFTLFFYPVVKAATLGQVQLWLIAGIAASMLYYLRGQQVSAGLLAGLLVLVKPQYGLFMIWSVMRGDRRFASAMLASIMAGLIASLAVFGLSNHLDYLKALQFLARHGESYFPNQTVNGVLGRLLIASSADAKSAIGGYWFPPYSPFVYFGTLLSSIAIVMASLYRPRSSLYERGLDFGTVALAATMASPIGWEHHYGVLLPICVYTCLLLQARPSAKTRLFGGYALFICFCLASNFIPFANATEATYLNFIQSYLFFAAAGIFVILLKNRTIRVEATAALSRS